MAKNNLKKILRIIAAAAFWIIIWEAASRSVNDSLALFLPGPVSVFKTFFRILPQADFRAVVGATLLRIFTGFIAGTVCGVITGIITGESKVCDMLLSPALKTVRAVPVVSFIILAFLFINVNKLPVFISSLMVTPLVWQAVHDSISGADKNLLEMSRVYALGRVKTLFFIKLHKGSNQIISAVISAVGLAWKSGVAAEVLCTPAVSLGKSIYKAKGNLNFDEVYALTITVVILSMVFEFLIKYLWQKYKKTEVKENA